MRYTITGVGLDGSERTVVVDADDEIEALSLGHEQGIVRPTAIRVRKSFTATKAWAGEDYWVFYAGVSEPDSTDELGVESHYELSFGRGVEKDEIKEIDPEWSQEIKLSYRQGEEPYVSGDECVAASRLERDKLEVDLSRPLGEGVEIGGFDISLNLDDSSYTNLRDGLRWIFQHRAGVLTLGEWGT